jgi:N6-adenosine-specific RNA methylase IME4
LCLLGLRGKIKRKSASIKQVVLSPIESHSKKPDIIRKHIVELVGDLPRIELFARQTESGWDSWGDQLSTQE